jgi:hypothetical protein
VAQPETLRFLTLDRQFAASRNFLAGSGPRLPPRKSKYCKVVKCEAYGNGDGR